jgi:hypothetical protein
MLVNYQLEGYLDSLLMHLGFRIMLTFWTFYEKDKEKQPINMIK